MRQWFHVDCFLNIKKTKNSRKISSSDDIQGWDLLSEDDKNDFIDKIGDDFKVSSTKSPAKAPKVSSKSDSKDNSFNQFQKIVEKIADEPSYNSKSQILQKYFRNV